MTAAPLVIAIDGPAAAGKSTLAKALATHLKCTYLDTGATYRALAWLALERAIPWTDAAALGLLADSLDLRFEPHADGQRVFVGDTDVTAAIRTDEISEGASQVSIHAPVRLALVALQQRIAAREPVVAEGRDTTTVVFPHAQLKLFLTAGRDERAQRRTWELASKGVDTSVEEVADALALRDDRDTHRTESPLLQAPDAIPLDTSLLDPDTVLATVLHLLADRALI